MDIKDKVFVITGSTQGIGRELGIQVLLRGGKVVFNSRSDKKVLIDDLGDSNNVLFVASDVTKASDVSDLISKSIDKFGRIDVLVNNAGMSGFGELSESSPSVIEDIINSNIVGSLLPTHFSIPHLIKSNGKVLFISSLAALHGLPNYSLYSCSKMALTGIQQSLSKELKSKVFVGIAYVGFTKNDDSKRTYAPDGTLESVPSRDKFNVVSQEETALLLLKQLMDCKESVVHSPIGKLTYIMSRFFPKLVHSLILNNYKNSKNS